MNLETEKLTGQRQRGSDKVWRSWGSATSTWGSVVPCTGKYILDIFNLRSLLSIYVAQERDVPNPTSGGCVDV